MAWDGPILTDSGGFQVYSLGHLARPTRTGSPSPAISTAPRSASPPSGRWRSRASWAATSPWPSTSSSTRRGQPPRCATPWSAPTAGRSVPRSPPAARPGQAVFGIVQGGIDPGLRRRSVGGDRGPAASTASPSGASRWGSRRPRWRATLDVVAAALGEDPRARYLMGVGSPLDFFAAVERGIDLFDCVLPTRVARNGQLWTSAGKLNLRNARFLDDGAPVDAACSCETCRNHSRAYLAHLFRAGGAARLSPRDGPQRHLYSDPDATDPLRPRGRLVRIAPRRRRGAIRNRRTGPHKPPITAR